MSRCVPYLPPDHVSQFNSAPRIESLKKVDMAKNRRKEKKHKRHQNDRYGQDHQNTMDQLENSNLTEEYGHQVSSQNSSDSDNFGSTITQILPCQSGQNHKHDQEGETEKASEHFVQTSRMSHNLKTNHSSNSSYELKLRSLLENWLPPSSCSEDPDYDDDDDQEWLFSQKPIKRIKGITDWSSYYEVSAAWPRVCHFPELDLYALPFTVPF